MKKVERHWSRRVKCGLAKGCLHSYAACPGVTRRGRKVTRLTLQQTLGAQCSPFLSAHKTFRNSLKCRLGLGRMSLRPSDFHSPRTSECPAFARGRGSGAEYSRQRAVVLSLERLRGDRLSCHCLGPGWSLPSDSFLLGPWGQVEKQQCRAGGEM